MYDEMMKRMQKEQEANDAAAAAVGHFDSDAMYIIHFIGSGKHSQDGTRETSKELGYSGDS